ncbi:MAG: Scr1 family TA system antitoxin-like transcriptional regulator [Micromonosporaceae bacterium]
MLPRRCRQRRISPPLTPSSGTSRSPIGCSSSSTRPQATSLSEQDFDSLLTGFTRFTIFELGDDARSPVVYVEGQAGGIYMERSVDVQRCNVAYNHLTAAALSPPASVKLIAAALRDLPAD